MVNIHIQYYFFKSKKKGNFRKNSGSWKKVSDPKIGFFKFCTIDIIQIKG